MAESYSAKPVAKGNKRGSANDRAIPETKFPGELPRKWKALIGSGKITGIEVLYTMYGMNVMAIRPDGSKVALEAIEREHAAEAVRNVLTKDRQNYLQRIEARNLGIESVPNFLTVAERDDWLSSLGKIKRLLELNNRDFRAYKATENDKTGVTGRASSEEEEEEEEESESSPLKQRASATPTGEGGKPGKRKLVKGVVVKDGTTVVDEEVGNAGGKPSGKTNA